MNEADPGGPLILALQSFVPPLLTGLTAGIAISLLYALVTAFEATVPALESERLEEEAEDNDSAAKALLRLKEDPHLFAHRARCAKLILLLLLAWVLCTSGSAFLQAVLPNMGPQWRHLTLLAMVLLAGFLLQAFCVDLPSRLARQSPETFVRTYRHPYRFLEILFYPISEGSRRISDGLLLRHGIDPESEDIQISQEVLRELLDRSNEGGTLPNEEHDLIENVFAFGDKTVEECMTHRVDIVAVELETELPELLEIVKEEKYSRIPVYQEDIDHILGIVNTRDLLLFASEENGAEFRLADLLREASYAPESAKILSVFKQMQREHNHMSVVIDEYGGTAGLVTMEDLLEEIVGSIQDEYDEEEPEIEPVRENCWKVEGATSLELIEETTGTEMPCEDFDTVAGLVLDLLDRIPDPDEHPSVHYRNLTLTVEQMEDRRIEKLLICLNPHYVEDSEEQAENGNHGEKELSI